MRKNHRTLMIPALIAASIGISLLMSNAVAQEGFSNASLRGTYMWWGTHRRADTPSPNRIQAGTMYFDGEGNLWVIQMIRNRPGEPDADGNPTRDIDREVSDPSTWNYRTGTYDVDPTGSFVRNRGEDNEFEGIAKRTEMIDGVLTIVEALYLSDGPSASGGITIWELTRIADADLVPQAPE